MDRRRFLQATGVSTIGAAAGCMGGEDGDGGGGDGGGGDGGDGGATTTTTDEGLPDPADVGEEEYASAWREKASTEAAAELEGGESLQFYTTTTFSEWFNGLLNERSDLFTGPWEPLRDNIRIVPKTASALEQQYVRETQAGTGNIDILKATQSDLIAEGVEFTDLTTIPSYRALPDNIKWPPYYAPTRFVGYGIAYNTDVTMDPPASWDDLLDDRFGDGGIAIDFTPTPPVVAAVMTIKKDREYVRQLGEMEPQFINSLFDLSQTVARGDAKVGFLAHTSHVYRLKNRDQLPYVPVKEFDLWIWRPEAMSVAATPGHPWAAKLFLDWWTHPDQADIQGGDFGAISLNGEVATPQEITEIYDPAESLVVMPDQFDATPSELMNEYLDVIGAPSN